MEDMDLYEKALGILNSDDVEKHADAFDTLLELMKCEVENCEIPRSIAQCYEYGIGVEENEYKAFEYLLTSANLGNDHSMNEVGNYYRRGKGTEKCLEKAIEFYRKSAKKNNSYGLMNLALAYENGEGVEQNIPLAIQYFKQSAEQENAISLTSLAYYYLTGTEIEQDYTKGIECYKKAAALDDEYACYQIGKIYFYGNFGLQQNKALGIEYLNTARKLEEKNALGEDTQLMIDVGNYFFSEEKDYLEAQKWYKDGAETGNVGCIQLYALVSAILVHAGRKVAGKHCTDSDENIIILEKCLGMLDECEKSGYICKEKKDVEEELACLYYMAYLNRETRNDCDAMFLKAEKLLKKLSDSENLDVKQYLALALYDKGENGTISADDVDLMKRLFLECIKNTVDSSARGISYYYLGNIFAKGIGGIVDLDKAFGYYTSATEYGMDCSEILKHFKKKLFGGYTLI